MSAVPNQKRKFYSSHAAAPVHNPRKTACHIYKVCIRWIDSHTNTYL